MPERNDKSSIRDKEKGRNAGKTPVPALLSLDAINAAGALIGCRIGGKGRHIGNV